MAKKIEETTKDAIGRFTTNLNEAGRAKIKELSTKHINSMVSAANQCNLRRMIEATVDRCDVMKELDKQINTSTLVPAEKVLLMVDALEIFSALDNEVVHILKDTCKCKDVPPKKPAPQVEKELVAALTPKKKK